MAPRRPKNKAWRSYAVIFVFTALGGLSLWYWGAPTAEYLEHQARIRDGVEVSEDITAQASQSDSVRVAERYLFALQNEVCSTTIELTWWMQNRLAKVRVEGANAEGAALEALCSSITDRNAEGYVLSAEGVEDQYLIAPLAQVVVTGLDGGRQDLDKGVRERVWIRVTYPVPTHAVRDENGTPITDTITFKQLKKKLTGEE